MSENKIPLSQEIKRHLLTGISWMIPLIVAAGICIALGQILGGTNVGEKTGTIPWMLNQIGGWGMGLIVPLISAAIAYSIADRPGFKTGPLFRHLFRFFLTHRASQHVRATQRIASQRLGYLHNLFLIQDDAVSRLQNRLQ